MKLVWFKRAVWDLRLVQFYIAQENPQAARKTVNQIKDKVSLLTEQPGIGRLGRVPNTRELIIDHTPYILPYRVRDNTIEILRVFHTSRKWPNKL
ncbi:type II toxin-antitoxin system RelE/ParE family toxin [Pseudomonadota bacterium]